MKRFREVFGRDDLVSLLMELRGYKDSAESKIDSFPATMYYSDREILDAGVVSPLQYLEDNSAKYSGLSPGEVYSALRRDAEFPPVFPYTFGINVLRRVSEALGQVPRDTLDLCPEYHERLVCAMIHGVQYTSVCSGRDARIAHEIISDIAGDLGADSEMYNTVNSVDTVGTVDTVDAVDTGRHDIVYADCERIDGGAKLVSSRGFIAVCGSGEFKLPPAPEGFSLHSVVKEGDWQCALYRRDVTGAGGIGGVDSSRFERIRFDRMNGRADIEKSLDIVRDFIIRKQRVLGGGMSIDAALKLKGSRLYGDDTIPDYDFLTPDHNGDAYEICQLLCTAGMPRVDVINAIHVTTQRVRVNGTVVADVTYAPKAVFDKIRRLEFGGMPILHPVHTCLDQVTALAMPFENAPVEVITQRWVKDIKRLNMLMSAYPLEKPVEKPAEKPESKLTTHKLLPPTGDYILTGWGALAVYLTAVDNPTSLKMPGEVEIPVPYLTYMTEAWRKFPVESKTRKFYNSMMGFPAHFEQDGFHVYDTLGMKIGVYGSKGIAGAKEQSQKEVGGTGGLSVSSTPLASLASLLWYFMHMWLRYDDQASHLGAVKTVELIRGGKFPLSIDVYGTYAWNTSFVKNIRTFFNPSESKFSPPMLSCKSPKPEWRPEGSPYFLIDGSECEEWKDPFDIGILDLSGSGRP